VINSKSNECNIKEFGWGIDLPQQNSEFRGHWTCPGILPTGILTTKNVIENESAAMVYKIFGLRKSGLLSLFLLLYGVIFLLTLLLTIFNWEVPILENFLTVGLLIFGITILGKILITLTLFILIISAIGIRYGRGWGIKTLFYFSILVVLFLGYLLVGIISNINTGHQTSASLAISIAVPFLPFIFFLGFSLCKIGRMR